jgi:hypothetical protein
MNTRDTVRRSESVWSVMDIETLALIRLATRRAMTTMLVVTPWQDLGNACDIGQSRRNKQRVSDD